MTKEADEHFDACVVGGGVAGTYVAHELGVARPEWRIALLERSERIGGRLLSLVLPGAEGLPMELGGMRFRTSQPHVTHVVRALGLPVRPFRTAHEDNQLFLRGARWRAGEPDRAARVYRLAPRERGVSPAELLVAAFERVVPRAVELSDEQWIGVKRTHEWRGRPLRDWTLAALLADVLSPEAHRYVLDGFAYATLLGERNAADAIPWILIETRPESENHTLVDGMERLPRELAARFAARGGQVRLRHELVAVEEDGGGPRLRLRLDGRPDVLTDRVVLALPARPLRRVAERSSLLDVAAFRTALGCVTAHAAAKLVLVFERPWWRDGGGRALRAVTDLPLSKTFYFDRLAPDVRPSAPLLLASYSDGPARDHWARLGGGRRAPHRASSDPCARWRGYAASEQQVREAQRQLALLHARDDVPDPVASAFVDWGGADGAWHVWDAGVSSWEVMPRVAEPVAGLPLHVCGEAYSWSQGWVEGALETAEDVVRRICRERRRP